MNMWTSSKHSICGKTERHTKQVSLVGASLRSSAMKASLAASEFLTEIVWHAVMIYSRSVPHVCQAAASGRSAIDRLHTPSAVACKPTAVVTLLKRVDKHCTLHLYVKVPEETLASIQKAGRSGSAGMGAALDLLGAFFLGGMLCCQLVLYAQEECRASLPYIRSKL